MCPFQSTEMPWLRQRRQAGPCCSAQLAAAVVAAAWKLLLPPICACAAAVGCMLFRVAIAAALPPKADSPNAVFSEDAACCAELAVESPGNTGKQELVGSGNRQGMPGMPVDAPPVAPATGMQQVAPVSRMARRCCPTSLQAPPLLSTLVVSIACCCCCSLCKAQQRGRARDGL